MVFMFSCKMYTARTSYVKDKISGRKFTARNREYIGDLVWLERFVIDGIPQQFSANLCFFSLKSRYQEDYAAIIREIDPTRYTEYLREQAQKAKQEADFETKLQGELVREKTEWVNAGGVV